MIWLASDAERALVRETHPDRLVARVRGSAAARQALDDVHAYWQRTLGAVQIDTPDPAVNVLANG